jgi:PAS domain S-box-containing protein
VSGHPGERIHRHQILAQQTMVAVGLVLHVAWYFLLRQMSPGGIDSVGERCAVSAVGAIALALSFVPAWRPAAASIGWGFGYLATAHYALLVARNPGDWAFSLASAIAVAGVSGAMATASGVLGYACFSIGLMVAATLSWSDWHTSVAHVAAMTALVAGLFGGRVWRQLRATELKAAVDSSRDFSAELLERMPGIVGVRDASRRFVLVNDAFCKVMRMSREQIMGRTASEMGVPAADERLIRHADDLKKGPVEYELVLEPPFGGETLLVKLAALQLRDGQAGTIIISRDVTARKAAETELARFQGLAKAAFDHATIGMAVITPDLKLLQVNHTLCTMLGRSEAEMVNASLADITHPDDITDCRRAVQQMLRDQADLVNYEKRYLHRDGRPVWVLVNASALSPARDLFLAQIIDVSVQHAVAEKLELARDQAEAATRAKSAFLATMSHEIRTPMNGVLAALDLALRGQLAGDEREVLQLARTSAMGLLRMVDDVLDLSKIEAGSMTLQEVPFHLRRELDAVVGPSTMLARQKDLELRTQVAADVPDLLVGDPMRLCQILTNLVGNAVKFTDRGEVSVQVSLVATAGERVNLRLDVSDTGPGIAEGHHKAVFKPFVQGSADARRHHGGTGLGLAIAAQLAASMGGRLSLRSEAGRGSTFTAELWLRTLRAGEELPAEDHPAPTPKRDARPLRLLLVEDNAVNLLLTRRLLEHGGYEVVPAASGAKALAELDRHAFDCVLMDVQLPDLDGLEVTRIVASRADTTNLPVIGVTAHAMAGDRERCLAAGMVDYVTKPVEFRTLDEAIRRAVHAHAPTTDLMAVVDNDRDLAAELCALFLVEHERLGLELSAALLRSPADVATVAHRFKGMLANLGATKAAAAAAALEDGSRREAVLAPLAEQLLREVAKFEPAARRLARSRQVERA